MVAALLAVPAAWLVMCVGAFTVLWTWRCLGRGQIELQPEPPPPARLDPPSPWAGWGDVPPIRSSVSGQLLNLPNRR